MARKKNQSIGTCPCPVRDCARVVPVYRYRERGESPVSVANRRFAGKLYLTCPDHGRMGEGAGMQEYILEHAYMPGAGAEVNPLNPLPEPPSANSKTPEKTVPAPATAPAMVKQKTPAAPAKARAGFGWPWD